MNDYLYGMLSCVGIYAVLATVFGLWFYCACKLSHKDGREL